jgi:outer membrane protein TolC
LDSKTWATYLKEGLATDHLPAAWGLTELTLAAFFYNPQLDVARAQWAVAKGHQRIASERPNPTLGVAPGFNSTTGYDAPSSPWIVTVVLDIPIETAGKRGYRIAQAEQLSQAAGLHIAEVAWEVRRQVRQAMLDLYAANQMTVLLDRQRGLQADNVELLNRLFEIGQISANELSLARVRRDEADLACLDMHKAADTNALRASRRDRRACKGLGVGLAFL